MTRRIRWQPTTTPHARPTTSSTRTASRSSRRGAPTRAPAVVDVDETELAEDLELPGADLSNEELSVRVLPRQADEFTCSRCFLVHHRSQLASEKNGQSVCRECAA